MNKLKFLLILGVFFMGACAASPASNSSGDVMVTQDKMAAVEDSSRVGRAPMAQNSAANSAAPSDVALDEADKSKQQPTERKIIRNAELTLEAASPEEAQQKVTAIAESKGGFVVESQQSSSSIQATTHDRVTMTLRVPADKFGETLEEIRKASIRVIVENVKGQDVTEEFIDVEARLKTKKALESQFLEIMKQGKTVEDALNVQRELANVRGEIEQIEGKKRFLESQTSLSTVKLTLQTPAAFTANSSGFFYQAGKSFGSGFNFAVNFVLGFITFIIAITPFLVLVVLPIYLLLRYFWKRWRKKQLAVQLAQEEKAE